MSVTPAACPLSAGVYCPWAGVTGWMWSFSAVTAQSMVVFFFSLEKCGESHELARGVAAGCVSWQGTGFQQSCGMARVSEMLSMKHTGAARAADLNPKAWVCINLVAIAWFQSKHRLK